MYEGGSKSLTYKSRAKWKMLRGIDSAIYGEVNVSVSGGYVLQYAGGTGGSSCFVSVTLKVGQAGNFWTLLRMSDFQALRRYKHLEV
jgi:hypothetical protein